MFFVFRTILETVVYESPLRAEILKPKSGTNNHIAGKVTEVTLTEAY